jgi:hypothetical protein
MVNSVSVGCYSSPVYLSDVAVILGGPWLPVGVWTDLKSHIITGNI